MSNTPAEAVNAPVTDPAKHLSIASASEKLLEHLGRAPAPRTTDAPKPTAKKEVAPPADEVDLLDDAPDETTTEPRDTEPVSEGDDADLTEDDELQAGSDDDDAPKVTVRTKSGKAIELTDDDIQGAMRRKDYSQKTAAIADARRKLDAELTAVQADRVKFAGMLEAQITAEEGALPPAPDENLKAIDPTTYLIQKDDRERAVARVAELKAKRASAEQETRETATKQLQSHVQGEYEKLVDAEPKWKDPARFKRDATAIKRIVSEKYGIPAQVLDAVTDHHTVLVLRDAARYHQMLAKRAEILPDGSPKLEVLKPGASVKSADKQATKRREALTRLEQRPTVRSGADAIKALGLLGRASR